MYTYIHTPPHTYTSWRFVFRSLFSSLLFYVSYYYYRHLKLWGVFTQVVNVSFEIFFFLNCSILNPSNSCITLYKRLVISLFFSYCPFHPFFRVLFTFTFMLYDSLSLLLFQVWIVTSLLFNFIVSNGSLVSYLLIFLSYFDNWKTFYFD